jgi:hypothetical protein
MKRLVFLVALACALIAPAAFAQPWAGAAGAGVPDESVISIYDANVGSAGYNASGSTTTIVLRYTVNDTTATGAPSWTTLAVDAYDPGGSSFVRAQLYRLTPGGGNNMITSCTSNDAAVYSTTTCPLLNSVNFNTGDTYSMVVSISRSSTAVTPFFRSVRLY